MGLVRPVSSRTGGACAASPLCSEALARMGARSLRDALRVGDGSGEVVRQHAGSAILARDRSLHASSGDGYSDHPRLVYRSCVGRTLIPMGTAGHSAANGCFLRHRPGDHDRDRAVRAIDRPLAVRSAHAADSRLRTRAAAPMGRDSGGRSRRVPTNLRPLNGYRRNGSKRARSRLYSAAISSATSSPSLDDIHPVRAADVLRVRASSSGALGIPKARACCSSRADGGSFMMVSNREAGIPPSRSALPGQGSRDYSVGDWRAPARTTDARMRRTACQSSSRCPLICPRISPPGCFSVCTFA